MKKLGHLHLEGGRYDISPEIAQKLAHISDDKVLLIDAKLSIREWHWEPEIQRYAIGHDLKKNTFSLIPVPPEYEWQTFVVLETSKEKGSLRTLLDKNRSKIRTLLYAAGITAAFLPIEIYLWNQIKGKEHQTDLPKKNIPIKQIQDVPVQTFSVSELLQKNNITLDDFLLNNPWIPVEDSHSLESLLHTKISLSPQIDLSAARVTVLENPFVFLLWKWMSLDTIGQNSVIQQILDEYYTVFESMIASECLQKDGNIPKDTIGWSDIHKGEQYAGINMNSAKNSGNPEKLKHAQEIAACYASGDQKKLRQLVKTYYILYYFPSVLSPSSAISSFLFDTSMNRGMNSIQPICKMAINAITWRKYAFSDSTEKAVDKEWKAFTRHSWNVEWTSEHQKIWDVLCTRFPYQLMQHLRDARRVYEDGTYGQRISIRPALENRWNKAQESAEEMFLPATYRTISYHDSVAMIEKSLTEKVPTYNSVWKPIIYRVQRIHSPTKEQAKAEEVYKNTIAQPRPKKEMVLFHGTASGVLGKTDERIRDLWWFNALYKSSAAAYVITSKGLIFEFFDPTKWYGAANATRIAESTGVSKEDFNFNDACVGVELCLRGYKGGPFSDSEHARYWVEPPTDAQKKACIKLWLYLKNKLGIQHIGTSADPVRDHTKCYDDRGKIRIGPEYLVPEAHCDDFSPEDRKEMGIESPEDMAKIFWNKGNLSSVFEFGMPLQKKLTIQ